MVDLWDALALVTAGGVLSLVTGILIQILSTRANRKSEERQAKRRVGEEQRQEIRKMRSARMQPVVEYLESAKGGAASRIIADSVKKMQRKSTPSKGRRD